MMPDAVQCAVDIQRGMAQRNSDEPENRRIVLRIGINLGDVMIEGDDDLCRANSPCPRLPGPTISSAGANLKGM